MFTVCPKCALTLVVTPQDLRVAQGYVRCGRCSNVFNAIVGLTDDRGALAGSGAGSQSTASTSTIRKAPSIDDEPPHDALSDTGETEAIYAEPDEEEVKFQEVFAEPIPPSARTTPGPISFVAPPPGPPVKAPPPAPAAAERRYSDSEGVEKRYSDTEGIETYPESELEFNPAMTDVTQVFVEAAPVTFKGNAATGKFEKIVLRPEERPPAQPASIARAVPQPTPPRSAPPVPEQVTVKAAAPRPVAAAAPKSEPRKPEPAKSAPPKPAAPSRPPPPAPRDEEDLQIDDDLRSLAARIDVTASRPRPKLPLAAANEEKIEERAARQDAAAAAREDATEFLIPGSADTDDEDEDRSLGDIYAKAAPRPPPSRTTGKGAASRSGAAQPSATLGNDDEFRADGGADSLTLARPPAPASRGRSLLWAGGGTALLLALVSQVIHHNRHELATTAFLNRPLTRIYAALGIPLVPSWDLNLYDVRQLGASTNENGAGTLTVRASLKNNASQSLPLPILRITMQDRYGNRIATRDVLPTGYVPGTVPAGARIGGGQRLDAEMTFKDPGQDAVGFEIDACLPSASGRIACANDSAVAPR